MSWYAKNKLVTKSCSEITRLILQTRSVGDSGLKHCGLMTPFDVSLVNISSDNALWHLRCQAITWTNTDLLSIRQTCTNFGETRNKMKMFYSTIGIGYVVGKFRPQCDDCFQWMASGPAGVRGGPVRWLVAMAPMNVVASVTTPHPSSVAAPVLAPTRKYSRVQMAPAQVSMAEVVSFISILSRCFSARLQYLHCVSNEDTAVLH